MIAITAGPRLSNPVLAQNRGGRPYGRLIE
jgi:hypothetical protein